MGINYSWYLEQRTRYFAKGAKDTNGDVCLSSRFVSSTPSPFLSFSVTGSSRSLSCSTTSRHVRACLHVHVCIIRSHYKFDTTRGARVPTVTDKRSPTRNQNRERRQLRNHSRSLCRFPGMQGTMYRVRVSSIKNTRLLLLRQVEYPVASDEY